MSDHDDLRDQVAAVLGQHVLYGAPDDGISLECACGFEPTADTWEGAERELRTHQADALVPLIREREAHLTERVTRAEEDANRAIDRRREARREGRAEGVAAATAAVETVLDRIDEGAAFSRRLAEGGGISHGNEQMALLAAECREGDAADLRAALADLNGSPTPTIPTTARSGARERGASTE